MTFQYSDVQLLLILKKGKKATDAKTLPMNLTDSARKEKTEFCQDIINQK